MNYQGDFAEDATVYITFNTFDSNDPSASVTITNLAQGDVEIWKDGIVQTTPGAGVTLTLNIGTGNGTHLIAVDTSNTTDAGWFATGSDYQARITGTTVDGATVNAWVGSFSIENRFMRGTDSANTTTPPTVTQIQAEMEEDGESLLDTISDLLPGTTIAAAADIPAMVGTDDAALASVLGSAVGVSISADIAAVKAETVLIVTDTGELQVDDIPGKIATLDTVVDGVETKVDTAITDIAAVKAETVLIVADTGELQVDDIPAKIATVQTEVDKIDALDTVADAIKVVTDLLADSATTLISGTVSHDNSAATTTNFWSDDIDTAAADHWNGRIVIFLTGALAFQATAITDYVVDAGEGKFTVVALTSAPADNVRFVIV